MATQTEPVTSAARCARGVWLGLAFAGFCSCTQARGDDASQRSNPGSREPGFAVLELFTSEGCSSCPPADALLAKLTRETAQAGQHVYALSFHVDYWDDLGWRDPFSSSLASSRQRLYAAGLPGGAVYTPQLVVNGHESFVGSNETRARRSIRAALARSPVTNLRISASAHGAQLTIRCEVTGSVPARAVINVAVVQVTARSLVQRGENAGRELIHANVVREFRSIPLAGPRAAIQLDSPKELAPGAHLIGYVQVQPSLEVVAAASQQLSQ